MPHTVLHSRNQAELLRRAFDTTGYPVTVEWQEGYDRSKAQNKLMWRWAGEVAIQRGDCDRNDVQAEWKLHHGVPILRGENESFREEYDRYVKPLSYEAKMALMRMDFPVTSRMKVKQMIRFMDAVSMECEQQGFRLTHPDDDLRQYQDRYRERAA